MIIYDIYHSKNILGIWSTFNQGIFLGQRRWLYQIARSDALPVDHQAAVGEPLIWVNYNDLTATEPWESWLVREIIPKWP